jgi:hypothetical protein
MAEPMAVASILNFIHCRHKANMNSTAAKQFPFILDRRTKFGIKVDEIKRVIHLK